jgi:2-C-methyl-D-erythritol 4-phosphate cytidylyltransferase
LRGGGLPAFCNAPCVKNFRIDSGKRIRPRRVAPGVWAFSAFCERGQVIVTVGVIIPAAGRGKRMGAPVNKPFLPLGGQPVLLHTLRVFDTHPQVDEIVVVSAARETERVKELLRNQGLSKVTQVIPGGAERQESVFRGLKVLSTEWVLVHDAVRPFVTHELIDSLLRAVRLHEAAVLAVPLKDTVKMVGEAGVVEKTPDRRRLWAVQTPQAFRRTLLEDAHRRAAEVGLVGTDDAMLVEELGAEVRVVPGDYANIKLTTPEDLAIAEAILTMRRNSHDKNRTRF